MRIAIDPGLHRPERALQRTALKARVEELLRLLVPKPAT